MYQNNSPTPSGEQLPHSTPKSTAIHQDPLGERPLSPTPKSTAIHRDTLARCEEPKGGAFYRDDIGGIRADGWSQGGFFWKEMSF